MFITCIFLAPLQFKTLRVEEYRLALRNLELHYQDFLRDSQDSETFGAEDRMQVESNYNKANQHYNTMVSSAEQGVYCSLSNLSPNMINMGLRGMTRHILYSFI